MNRTKKRVLLCSATIMATIAAAPALAQNAEPRDARTTVDPTIDNSDIIVTANKRSERALEVAGAISAFRGDDLLANGLTSIKDFAGFTPGLQFNNALGTGAPIIRGLSVGIDTSPTVASVVNGAPIGSSSSLAVGAQDTLDLDPIDIERVEVLKGPQGTLYGASTLGGLISYALREPDLTKSAAIVRGEAAATEHGKPSYSIRAALSTPLVKDQLAVGLSGFYDRRGGFIDNDVRNIRDQNSAVSWGVRGSIVAQMGERLKLTLNGFYQSLTTDAGDFAQYDYATRSPANGDLHYDDYTLPSSRKRVTAAIANIDYDFGFATLSSITSIQHITSDNRQNVTNSNTNVILSVLLPSLGGVPFPAPAVSELNNVSRYNKKTQELRLTSTGNSPFSWIVGGYYSHEKDQYDAVFRGRTITGAAIPALDPALQVGLTPSMKEYSAFANATYKFSPAFDITGGFRIGGIDQTYRQALSGSDATAYNLLLFLTTGNIVPPSSALSKSSATVKTYLATARYHFSQNGILFARVATGFRSGGPNIAGPGLQPTFAPDRTTNYEGGLKTRILGGRGSIDITGYYTRWNNIIVPIAPGGITGFANGGDARVYGVETAVSLRPVTGLSLNGTFSYSVGNLIRSDPAAAGFLIVGDRMPYSPRTSGSLVARYSAPLSDEWTAYGSGSARYSASRLSVFSSNPDVYKLPAYTLVDLHAGIESERFTIDLFVKNVTDKRAQLAANSFYIPEVAIQRPRTFGIALTGKY